MNDMSPLNPAKLIDEAKARRLNPFQAEANRKAAEIAAREVRGRAIHCPIHRQSLADWEAGLRDWPWPDPTEAQQQAADDAVLGLARLYTRGME